LRRRLCGAAYVAPILAAVAFLGCTDAFSVSSLPGVSAFAPAAPATNALGSWKLASPVDSRRAPLRAQNGAAGVSMKAVRNPQLIGTLIPRQWTEGSDFVRDGRGISTGDLVIIRRSDGRCVGRTGYSDACCCSHSARAMLCCLAGTGLFACALLSKRAFLVPSQAHETPKARTLTCAATRAAKGWARSSARLGCRGRTLLRSAWRSTTAKPVRLVLRRASIWASPQRLPSLRSPAVRRFQLLLPQGRKEPRRSR
jgi:hypothetical protein